MTGGPGRPVTPLAFLTLPATLVVLPAVENPQRAAAGLLVVLAGTPVYRLFRRGRHGIVDEKMTARLDIATCLIAASAVSCGFDTGGWTSSGGGGPDASRPALEDANPTTDAARTEDGAPALDAGFACPSGYEIAGESGSAYRGGTALAWLAAESACEADGAGTHLVVIDDSAENATVDAISGASRTWIGYSDLITADTWRWVTSAPGVDDRWDTGGGGGPDEPDGTGDCAAIDQNGSWQDQSCADARDYVCECDGRSPDPDAF